MQYTDRWQVCHHSQQYQQRPNDHQKNLDQRPPKAPTICTSPIHTNLWPLAISTNTVAFAVLMEAFVGGFLFDVAAFGEVDGAVEAHFCRRGIWEVCNAEERSCIHRSFFMQWILLRCGVEGCISLQFEQVKLWHTATNVPYPPTILQLSPFLPPPSPNPNPLRPRTNNPTLPLHLPLRPNLPPALPLPLPHPSSHQHRPGCPHRRLVRHIQLHREMRIRRRRLPKRQADGPAEGGVQDAGENPAVEDARVGVEVAAEGVKATYFTPFRRRGWGGLSVEGEEMSDSLGGIPSFGHQGVALTVVGDFAGHGDWVEGGVVQGRAEEGVRGEVVEDFLGEAVFGGGVSGGFVGCHFFVSLKAFGT